MHPNDSPSRVAPLARVSRIAITPPGRHLQGTGSSALVRPTTPTTPEHMIAALTATGAFRVLRRLQVPPRYTDPRGAKTHTALFIDVETTGLKRDADHIIQLAMVPFTFTEDGCVCDVRRSESWYEDPGIPISAEITRLTGIRQEDVAGQRIDDARVQALLDDAVLVIAHNAAFDRPFLERRISGFAALPWACSMAEVPWIEEGLPTTKLEWLSEKHAGVFYDAHRADVDCFAGIHLLASTLPSGRRAMAVLLDRVREKTVRVWAVESPFVTKGLLKERGYRWSAGDNGSPKAWFRDLPETALDEETCWLRAHIYLEKPCPAVMQRVGARTRYSHRIAALPRRTLVPDAPNENRTAEMAISVAHASASMRRSMPRHLMPAVARATSSAS